MRRFAVCCRSGLLGGGKRLRLSLCDFFNFRFCVGNACRNFLPTSFLGQSGLLWFGNGFTFFTVLFLNLSAAFFQNRFSAISTRSFEGADGGRSLRRFSRFAFDFP